MSFNCRAVKPEETLWQSVDGTSPEAAAGEYQEHYDPPFVGWKLEDGGRIRFTVVEVEGHGEFVTRQFRNGIYRRGGVKRGPAPTLEEVARKLGWTHAPAELIEAGWKGEETEWR